VVCQLSERVKEVWSSPKSPISRELSLLSGKSHPWDLSLVDLTQILLSEEIPIFRVYFQKNWELFSIMAA